ncbi:MAG: CNP1-like family protein, partial [Zoogloeaceae bacterium]|nr:CNP1-like family protein [Zoogloeaceae bacterium]
PSGARNVTHEGMRCKTRERRIYATGGDDDTWRPNKVERWFPVRESSSNRQYAALFVDFFCPDGIVVEDLNDLKFKVGKGSRP